MSEVNRTDEIQGEIIHEYDGIEEADNDLPRWWLFIFYASVAFAVFYWFYYHEYGAGLMPEEEYAAAMLERAGDEVSTELLTMLAEDEEAVSEGQKLFQANCVACHGASGEGQIGPNLTDPYWIHGGDPMSIYGVIDVGVLDKGMPPWAGPLGPVGMKNVTAYVLSIRDDDLPGKEPQGERWEGGTSPAQPEQEPADEAPADDETAEPEADAEAADAQHANTVATD